MYVTVLRSHQHEIVNRRSEGSIGAPTQLQSYWSTCKHHTWQCCLHQQANTPTTMTNICTSAAAATHWFNCHRFIVANNKIINIFVRASTTLDPQSHIGKSDIRLENCRATARLLLCHIHCSMMSNNVIYCSHIHNKPKTVSKDCTFTDIQIVNFNLIYWVAEHFECPL